MPEGQLLNIFIMVILLCFSAFFSGSEAAFLSVERVRVAHLVSSGVPGARLVADLIEKPERLLSTILLGNNLVNIAFTAIITVLFVAVLGESQGVLVATVLGTIIVLIFGEITPKAIAVRNAERVAFLNSRPLRAVELGLWPVVVVLQWFTRRIQILFSGSSRGQVASVTEGEIRMLLDISEAEGTLEPSEVEMLENVFRFGDRQVREVMTPRPEIIAIKRGASLREFLDIYSQNSHTRFPVYKDSVDDIIGIISAKDVLKAMATRGIAYEDSVTDLIRDALFVPETKRIAELFDEMRLSGNQMAMMVDEYGGLAGVVTLKRLSEEVVGPVGEEGEAPEEEYETIDENTFQIEGGMSIEEANEELKLGLPEGDFDTVAGFVLQTLGHIPVEGEQFDYRNLTFEIIEMSDLKIETIKVIRLQPVGITSDSGEEPPIAPE
jgi:putative hemolysin